MAELDKPTICPCKCTCTFLNKFDPNIYDIESNGTFLRAFFDVVCDEFCDINVAKQKAKNNFYLSKSYVDEPVIKGEAYGTDCFICKSVVAIDSIGDSMGGNDYRNGIDFVVTECGVEWQRPYSYYGYSYYPYGGQGYPVYVITYQPETGAIYYVTYKCGVQNSRLYDNFGILVGLIKKDYQTYEDYRKAIQALIIAFLLGPTTNGLKQALSPFVNESDIQILESYKTGWEMNVSILYSKVQWQDSTIDVSDGTVLKTVGEDFVWDLSIYNSDLIDDKDLISDIVEKIRPAHTLVYVHFL